MASNVPSEQPEQKRVLAAIVFTDVVGFSKLTGQNESRTFVAVQRDLTLMQNLCRSHRGEVLNTMGDGMMMSFSSAVDAMACALEIQRTIFSQGKTLSPGDRLEHRIGVHIGDIIRDGANVFGDGVNVAARLQAAAKPGAICYSGAVHDIVKNKLKFDFESTTQQQMKNVGIVKMWQVPPIRDFRLRQATAAITEHQIDTSIQGGAKGLRALSLLFTSAMLVLGIGLLFLFIKKPPTFSGKPVKSNLGKVLNDTKTKLAAQSAKKDPALPKEGEPNGGTPPAGVIDEAVTMLVKRYDFDGAVKYLADHGTDKTPEGTDATTRYAALSQMMAWLQNEVSTATADKPIIASLAGGDGKFHSSKVFQGKLGVSVDAGAGPVDQSLRDFKPESILSLARVLAEAPVTGTKPDPKWIEMFQKEFNVTA